MAEHDEKAEAGLPSSLYPVLPPDTGVQYLAEGAANIVYRLDTTRQASRADRAESGTSPVVNLTSRVNQQDDYFTGKLLRLRKELPTTIPCMEAFTEWRKHIAPLFARDQILDQSLCDLRPGNFIKRLNQALNLQRKSSGGPQSPIGGNEQPLTRHGTSLANDDYGLLVTDMTPGSDAELLEFKPKWLVQSPSAPKDSIRCRTCALRARRDYHRLRNLLKAGRLSDEDKKSSGFCPLQLISPSDEVVRRNARHILSSKLSKDPHSEARNHQLIQRFSKFLQTDPIFSKLASNQTKLDSKDVLFRYEKGTEAISEEEIIDLLISMTLRDCSLFLHMPTDLSKPITARIGDLDMKSRLKIREWAKKERELIDEGWYQGTEKYLAEELSAGLARPRVCMLNKALWEN